LVPLVSVRCRGFPLRPDANNASEITAGASGALTSHVTSSMLVITVAPAVLETEVVVGAIIATVSTSAVVRVRTAVTRFTGNTVTVLCEGRPFPANWALVSCVAAPGCTFVHRECNLAGITFLSNTEAAAFVINPRSTATVFVAPELHFHQLCLRECELAVVLGFQAPAFACLPRIVA